MTQRNQSYGRIAKILHWVVGLLIVAMLIIGLLSSIDGLAVWRGALITFHKSLGLTILLLMIIRLLWRLTYPAPGYPQTITHVEKRLAHLVHSLLYACIFAIILVGWSMSALGGHQTLFWCTLNVTLPLPFRPMLESIGSTIHLTLAWMIVGLPSVHIGAVVWHQVIKKDKFLNRML